MKNGKNVNIIIKVDNGKMIFIQDELLKAYEEYYDKYHSEYDICSTGKYKHVNIRFVDND